MISISLIHCCEKVCTHMDTWRIGKNSMKISLLSEKRDIYSYLNMQDITDTDYAHKQFVKILK